MLVVFPSGQFYRTLNPDDHALIVISSTAVLVRMMVSAWTTVETDLNIDVRVKQHS
jgi:hypothetical protein